MIDISYVSNPLVFNCFLIFIHFWAIESTSRVGAEREGDAELKQTPGSQPDAGLELTSYAIITWAEVGRLTDWATHAPLFFFVFKDLIGFIQWFMSQAASHSASGKQLPC